MSRLGDELSREMRFCASDRRRLSRLSVITDGHAGNSAWTSRSGKACSNEGRIRRVAVITRHQKRVVRSHDGLVVLFVVALDVRHVSVLTRSPLHAVDVAGVQACGNSLDRVGWRERTIRRVEVVVVLSKHEVGFDGMKLVWVNTINAGSLAQVGTVDVWSVKSIEHGGMHSLTGIWNWEWFGRMVHVNRAV